MASNTARMALKRPVIGDGFATADHYNNLTILDGFPGIAPCTSGARPAGWGAAHTGMHIFETDTGLTWRWNGSAFVRAFPIGLLADPSQISADFPTAATTATAAITATVTIPATNAGSTTKRIRVSASWYGLDNGAAGTLGACEVSLWRASTPLTTILWRGRPTTATDPLDWGMGGTIEAYDNPTAGAGVQYTLRVNSLASIGGTTTLRASVSSKATLSVTEVGL